MGVSAADYDAALAFYGNALGLSIERSWNRGESDRGTLFRAGAALIEILPRSNARQALKAAHDQPMSNSSVWLYLEVDDVDVAHERLQAHGASVLLPPTDEPWGHRRLRRCDPDGMIVGLFSRSDDK
ncbi:MAG: VOC family protein [Gemmatimonadota bacterium]|nr:VOC family protein [Gemmatimonadota bacterium]